MARSWDRLIAQVAELIFVAVFTFVIALPWESVTAQTTSPATSETRTRPTARNTAPPLNPEAWKNCASQKIRTAINGCTRVIQSKGEVNVWLARALYNRGKAHQDSGDFSRAIADFDHAIRLAPRYAQAFCGRARAYSAKGDDTRAIADLNEAIRLKPDFAEAYVVRGRKYDVGVAQRDHAAAIADFDAAIKLTDEAIRLKHDLPDSYSLRGEALSQKGEKERGIADINESLRLEPNKTNNLQVRCLYRVLHGEYAAALTDAAQAIKIQPDFVYPYLCRAMAYQLIGKLDLALADFDHVIKQAPGLYIAYMARGTLHTFRMDYVRSLADFDKAVALSPQSAHAHQMRDLAKTLVDKHGAIADAADEFLKTRAQSDDEITGATQVIRTRPDSAAYQARARAYIHGANYDAAIADLTEAIRLKSDNFSARYDRAWAYGQNSLAYSDANKDDSNDKNAIQDLTEIIRQQADNAQAYGERGWLYRRKGEYEKAIADFDSALRIQPNDLATLAERNMVYEHLILRANEEAQGGRPKIAAVPMVGQELPTTVVAISPNNAQLLTGGEDGTVRLWDTATGKLLRTLSGHAAWITAVAFAPDGSRVLTGSIDHTVKIWDVKTGTLLSTLPSGIGSSGVAAFSPDGSTIVTSDKLWTTDGKLLHTLETNFGLTNSVAFSPDGTRLLIAVGNVLSFWDIKERRLLRVFEQHGRKIHSVAFSPDGRFVLSGAETDGVEAPLKLLDVATGNVVFGCIAARPDSAAVKPDEIRSVAFAPDGKRFFSAGKSGITIWDASNGRQLISLEDTRFIPSIAVSADGTHLASVSLDGAKLWDLETNKLHTNFKGMSRAAESIAYSIANGRFYSAGKGQAVHSWDLATGHLQASLIRTDDKASSGYIRSIATSADGARLVAANDKALEIWDTKSGTTLLRFDAHPESEYVSSLAVSPDGMHIASAAHESNAVKLWDATTGNLLKTLRTDGAIRSLAFSSDGRWIATAGGEYGDKSFADMTTEALRGNASDKVDAPKAVHTIILWDVTNGIPVRSLAGHKNTVTSLVFSPDGNQLLSGSMDGTLKVWDKNSGKLLREILLSQGYKENYHGHWGSASGSRTISTSAIFSPDGNSVLAGGWDGAIRQLDLSTGKLLRVFVGHAYHVDAITFSPDRHRIISSGQDGRIIVWDAASGTQLAVLFAQADGEWLTLTPAGFFAASSRGTEMLSVVRGLQSFSVMQFYRHLHRPDLVVEALKGDREGKYKSEANVLSLEAILNSGPPPKLERVERKNREGGTATFAIRLTDRGGGIGDMVVWRVNGITQGFESAPGLGGPISPGRYVVMEQILRFDPTQKNEVEVVAYNGKKQLATPPLRFTIDPIFGVNDKPKPRLFVLAVGVDNYLKPDWRLSNAVNDAKSIGEAFKTVGGAFFGEGSVEVIPVLDERATEQGIGAAFDQLAAKVEPQDVFILYLSGHGRAIAGNGPGTGWFFLPQNLDLGKQTIPDNAIGAATLEAWLRRISASKSIVILDACESGAYEAPRGDNLVSETTIAQFTHATGRSTISAAPQGKAAYEGYQGHGILTYAILEALSKIDGAGDEVDLYSLGSHVSRRVIQLSKSEFGIVQMPKTDLKDNFTLGIRKPVLKPVQVECKLPQPPGKISHMMTHEAQVREQPSSDAVVALTLPKYAAVTLKVCAGSWGLVAREGKDVGYVPLAAMIELR